MATLNYTDRLARLQNRKFDGDLQKSIVSESFGSRELPEDIKYLLESMSPIGQDYNAKTIKAAQNVQSHLEREFDLHFSRAYRTQGSVMTGTNIKTHSDIDLLAIIDKYHYQQDPVTVPYTASVPSSDIKELREQTTKILKSIYDEVDASGESCVSIYNKSLRRHVDVAFCFWYNTSDYNRTSDEYYRGVDLYKHPHGRNKRDYPFAHLRNVNNKGIATRDGSRRGIRLLKNLRADSATELKELKSFQITTIVHDIENIELLYQKGDELAIPNAVSNKLGQLIDNPEYRWAIDSPNTTEKPLQNDNIVPDLILIKTDLDTLIADASSDVRQSYQLRRALLTY